MLDLGRWHSISLALMVRGASLCSTARRPGTLGSTRPFLHYAQDDIPFGGIGQSGMGAYHGHEGFKTMSHAKGVFEQARFNFTDMIRPPFGKLFDFLVNSALR